MHVKQPDDGHRRKQPAGSLNHQVNERVAQLRGEARLPVPVDTVHAERIVDQALALHVRHGADQIGDWRPEVSRRRQHALAFVERTVVAE